MAAAGSPEPGPPLWLLAELTYRYPLHCVFCSNPVDHRRSADGVRENPVILSTPRRAISGTDVLRGLALRSRTRLVFRLPGKFNRLRAVAGIDDADQEHGHVRLSIEGDGRVLFDGAIAGGQPPQELDIDLSGVKRLTILVDYGEQGDVGDFLDLCDARILK